MASKLQGIDQRQVSALAARGWTAERIALDLGLDIELVRTAMPRGLVDQLAASPTGTIELGPAVRVVAVAPSTDADEGYYLTVMIEDGSTVCSCKGFRFRSACKHTKALTSTNGEVAESS